MISEIIFLPSSMESIASVSETEDDSERVDASEDETNDHENKFSDTCEFLSLASFESNKSDIQTSSFSPDD
ncbi:hypothetical protein NC653_040567 [Populus alba x Populus x berolinensis]|uniref:Uncharacterized protein n=2 Tax=Populus alba x Populus x berolinensis TaxID=444605 RepID=A0AAD6PMZ1_9ROSI|nr:hypothetical protein NC653_040567 [Populus alba x Populus x berolinensis]